MADTTEKITEYVSDMKIEQILAMAKRNTTKVNTEEMESLIFINVNQFDRLRPYLVPSFIQEVLDHENRTKLLQSLIDAKWMVTFWETKNGMNCAIG